jgi:PAS domain S-box-containing protein
MSATSASAARSPQSRVWRRIPWIGGLFIAAIAAMAAHDIYRGYRVAVSDTGRELDSQARVIAEQTARSLQTVDRVLAHVVEEHASGALAGKSQAELHAYLKDQAVGMIQVEGLSLIDSAGKVRATSLMPALPEPLPDVSSVPLFQALRADRRSGLVVDGARLSVLEPGTWIFPIVRRLEAPGGEFAGGVVAGGRVAYFQQFYRDIRMDEGTKVTLMHRNGTLVARHPPVESALGQRFPLFDAIRDARSAGEGGPWRVVSPLDGVERFGALEMVPEYPLAVAVTRDVSMALAAWRHQALGTAARTLALGVLAAALLAMLRRQFARLDQTRESLEVSRERFALAAAGSDVGIWDWHVDGDRIYASPRARELFGAGPGPEQVSRDEWYASVQIHPDDAAARIEAIRAHMAGETPVYSGEYRVRGGDGASGPSGASGEYRWIRVRGLCVRDAAGQALRMAGSVADIDSRRRAEDALRVSEERFALAVAGSNDGIVDWDIVGDRMYTSPRTMQMLGVDSSVTVRTRAEWLEMLKPMHPDDRQRHADDLRMFLESDATLREGDYRLPRGNGEYRWVRLRNLCVRDATGKPLRLAGSVSDIDAYKRVEAALRESEERYALAMTGSNEGHWVWDIERDQAYASPRMNQILGLPPQAHQSSYAEYIERIPMHPDDRPRVRQARDQHLAGTQSRLDVEYRIVIPGTGEIRWIQARGQVFRSAAGKPMKLAGSIEDITQRKRTEEALRHSEERFARAVAGSDDGIWDADYTTGMMFSSRRSRQILGLVLEPETQPLEESYAMLQVHPDDAAQRIEAMQAHLSGKTPAYEGEWRVRQPDASYRWVRVRGVCVRDAAGKPLRMAGSVSDIDARKRTEEALRQSEERFALAVAGSDDGVWDFDYTTDRAFASRRARQIIGLPLEPEVQTLDEWFAALPLHPDDLPKRHAAMQAHLDGLTPAYEGEWRSRQGDGSYRWVRVRGMCVRDAAGKPLRMAGSVSDIDARKRAQESLLRSEERYALAVAGSDDGVWDWDYVTGVAFESKRARELQALPPGPESQPIPELVESLRVHPEDAPRRAEGIRAHLAGETPAYECDYRVRHDDGQYRWIHVRALCIRDASGNPVRMAGSVTDIDARKNAEAALRISEERYELAVAGSNEGMWDWDMRNETFFFSTRAQSLFGLEPGEPMRPCDEWWTVFQYHPEDQQRVREAMQAYLDGAGQHWEVEYRIRHRRSGDWHWYRERGVALRDATGKPYRMAGSLEDISARKRAEAERIHLEAQLRQAQKLEAIGTLAGGIAHDFNNILAAILGYAEMVQKDSAEGTAQRRHIDAALSAGMRAKSLVERILAFSRSGMGERVPVHVQSVVGEALDAVAASLPAGIALVRQLDAGDAAVTGDPTQVHQVVMNLCANAVQAMKTSGTLTVSLECLQSTQPRCTTGVLANANYVCLRVRDTGTGIAPQVLERIFDPFFTTKEVGVGTGLGLSLVHGIVTDLGGGIDVKSDVGSGSAFTVYLPWQSSVTAPVPLEEAAAPNGNGETILLVDDEESLVRLGEEMIAELGYEPVGFTSSKAALATFQAEPQRFNVVLSDEAMPEMTGSELVREIRRIRPDIPIVMMSGYVTAGLSGRARDAGVAEVLSKPLVSRDIARSLASALRQ